MPAEDLVLTASDGARFSAHLARPANPSDNGVVILPDVRGLYAFYCALAGLFAEAGIPAVAIDYFGRTAGLAEGRAEDFDWQSQIPQVKFDQVALDTAAAIDHLRGLGVEKTFTVGFCFGGAMSWRQSADQPGLAGAIGFYGRPDRAADRIGDMKAPLLMLLAGADSTPAESFEVMLEQLDTAAVPYSAITYPGAPHSFFDRAYDQWRDACADSWIQVLDFIEGTS
jgi:carboxymethylenebutenolidase